MNEEIVEQLEAQTQVSTEELESKPKTTWLMFSIGQKKYAVRSSDVLEIIRDVAVYKLPFMPSYIEGVLNRRGDPFTVINPKALLGDEDTTPPEEPLFMIFKRDDDQLSLHISDILFFSEIEENAMSLIPNNNDDGFFLGTLGYNDEEIPALNPNAFEVLIRKELGSA
ncbi:chemotaxis protein CheW [Treponema sp.]|uniref:chemotaxis protein CheW n=1 Tax=Treponema sp. TaxID=166 RepID=UPI00298E7F99|nr:chemotaxis protein CheW [Treponema sp.]MCR5612649.1 chemotaxis protein CheW [Treponema sp.]